MMKKAIMFILAVIINSQGYAGKFDNTVIVSINKIIKKKVGWELTYTITNKTEQNIFFEWWHNSYEQIIQDKIVNINLSFMPDTNICWYAFMGPALIKIRPGKSKKKNILINFEARNVDGAIINMIIYYEEFKLDKFQNPNYYFNFRDKYGRRIISEIYRVSGEYNNNIE